MSRCQIIEHQFETMAKGCGMSLRAGLPGGDRYSSRNTQLAWEFFRKGVLAERRVPADLLQQAS